MRSFGVPFNINKEDKIIGGFLSMRQAFWVAIPIAIVLLLFVADRSYILQTSEGMRVDAAKVVVKIVIVLLTFMISFFLAFASMDGTRADEYTLKFIKFKLRKKVVKYNDKI